MGCGGLTRGTFGRSLPVTFPCCAALVLELFAARQSRHPRRHSPEVVFAVVSDVAKYHEFVPWCVGSDVLSHQVSHQNSQARAHGRHQVHRTPKHAPHSSRGSLRPWVSQSDSYMEAELAVGFKMFTERYLSKVTMQRPKHVRAVAANTQLFRSLVNEWRFRPGPEPGTTWLEFRVDFAFKSALYAQASALFQDEVARRMVSAFEHRCDALYGRGSGATSPLPREVEDEDDEDAGQRAAAAPASAPDTGGGAVGQAQEDAAPREGESLDDRPVAPPLSEATEGASSPIGSSGGAHEAGAPSGRSNLDRAPVQSSPEERSPSPSDGGYARRVTAASSARGAPFRISSGLRVRRPRLRSPPPPLPDKGRSLW